MKRRNFIKNSLACITGYSLVYKATGSETSIVEDKKSVLPTTTIGEKYDDLADNITAKSILEPNMFKSNLECDIVVCGGGMAGVCAAISSARNGKKTILVQDRSRLGGNASSEIMVFLQGVQPPKTGWREGGILEEIKLENLATNPQHSWQIWDLVLYDKCVSEPNLTLLLDTSIYSADVQDDKITAIKARSDRKMTLYNIKAKSFIDCTGDGRLGIESNAEMMCGREGKEVYGESAEFADFDDKGTKMGSSIKFTSRNYGKPMKFIPPKWAKKITAEQMKMRPTTLGFEYGFWYVELGGRDDAIKDEEMLRHELLAIVLGIWDYIKNVQKHPAAKNQAIDHIAMLPGRRETFRIKGEHIFTEHDVRGKWKQLDDGVCVGGWGLDTHPADGYYSTSKASKEDRSIVAYNIPISSLYSKNIKNLFMAGRNVSCSHVGLSSTRVISTCAVMGQAVGTCAAMCLDKGLTASEFRNNPKELMSLQQRLLSQDQTILNIKNEDELDLARIAKISANTCLDGTCAENVVSGIVFNMKGEKNEHRWRAEVSKNPELRLDWDSPKKIGKVQITFDSGSSIITIHSKQWYHKISEKALNPIVKDYTIWGVDEAGNEKLLVEQTDNYQRFKVHKFPAQNLKSVILKIASTNGDKIAGVFEIRAYNS